MASHPKADVCQCAMTDLIVVQEVSELVSCVLVTNFACCQGIHLYQELTMVVQLPIQLLDLLSVKPPGAEVWFRGPKRIRQGRPMAIRSRRRVTVNFSNGCGVVMPCACEVTSRHPKHLIGPRLSWKKYRKTPANILTHILNQHEISMHCGWCRIECGLIQQKKWKTHANTCRGTSHTQQTILRRREDTLSSRPGIQKSCSRMCRCAST